MYPDENSLPKSYKNFCSSGESIGQFSGTIDSSDKDSCTNEPFLKYEKIGEDLPSCLKRDHATCFCVHSKIIFIGTDSGSILVFDHLGNCILSMNKLHNSPVNRISVNEDGDYIASCSNTGQVFIKAVHEAGTENEFMTDSPVTSIIIDPFYDKPYGKRRFAVGCDRLLMFERSFLSKLKATVLYDGAFGPVQSIALKDPFLAWANDTEVYVYHTSMKKTISVIKNVSEVVKLSECIKCNLYWTADDVLTIGWADSIQVGVVRKRSGNLGVESVVYYVEITRILRTDLIICGIASLRSLYVVLTGCAVVGDIESSHLPTVHIIRPRITDYEDLSTDELAVSSKEFHLCNCYHMEWLREEDTYFILTSKDVIVARLRDGEDHLDWLLEHQLFGKALNQLKLFGGSTSKHSIRDVGRKYMDDLLSNGEYDLAASFCETVFGKNINLWEEEVYRYASFRQLAAISPYVPCGVSHLSSTLYELMLFNFLHTDPERFLRFVLAWSPSLYNCNAVINAVLEYLLKDSDNSVVFNALGALYSYQGKYSNTLSIYLTLGKTEAFNIIQNHQLYSELIGNVAILVKMDVNRAVDLLTEHPFIVPPEGVVTELSDMQESLFIYLKRLYQRHETLSFPYHDSIVQFYALYEPQCLFQFLRSSTHYSLQKALDVCRSNGLAREHIYLLGRTGSTREALKLIILQLDDIRQAIEFCKEQSDTDLWDDLVSLCLNRPNDLKELILHIGTHIDPVRLIRKIGASNAYVSGLKSCLLRVLQDSKSYLSMQHSLQKIASFDCFLLHRDTMLVSSQRISLSHETCSVCGGVISDKENSLENSIVIFYCRHIYHRLCLPGKDRCVQCERLQDSSAPMLGISI